MARCLNCMEVYDDRYDICPYCGFQKGTPPKVASHLVPGTVLDDRYIIGTVIGYGGFGVTYMAWDEDLGIKIAIKEYYPNGLVNRVPGTANVLVLGGEKKTQYDAGLQRFLQEARTMAKFSKEPNIVYVYGFLEANNTAYIIMELLEGTDLKTYVTQFPDQKMAIDDALHVINEVGKALVAIHKGKVVHRDISPDNIFLCRDGRVKLLDFGAARLSTGEKTQTLSVVLKPGYAPPEQYRSKSRQGPRTDVYALAATLYKLITGKLPVESLDRVVEDTLEKPSFYNAEIPPWLDSVILTGMAKNAEVRFSSVGKFLEALNHEKTVKSPDQKIKFRRWTRAVSIIVVALIVGFASYQYFGMYSDISGEGVPNGKITAWIPVSTDADENRYKELEESFEKKFKGKDVDFKYIDASSYEKEVNAAISAGTGPTVFMGDYVDDTAAKASIKSIWSDLPLRAFYLLRDHSKAIKESRSIPLGFTQDVLYENTYLSNQAEISYVEEDGVDLDKADKKEPVFDSKYTKTGDRRWKDVTYSETAQKEFLAEDLTYYVGDVSEKGTIQKSLSGYSDVTAITKDGMSVGSFKNSISINAQSDKKEQKIARLLIKYALSEEGQDVICVRNQGLLPLNKKTFSTYTDVNESLKFIEPNKVDVTK